MLNVSLTDTRNGSIYAFSSPNPYYGFTSVSGCQLNTNPLLTFN